MEPTQAVLAFIYPGLDWRPEPVLQGYSAYTSYLDRLNATFLASSRAPERILYQRQDTIDGRDPWNDPPATLESMYCHYVELAAYGDDQVLARLAPGPGRCGRPRAGGAGQGTLRGRRGRAPGAGPNGDGNLFVLRTPGGRPRRRGPEAAGNVVYHLVPGPRAKRGPLPVRPRTAADPHVLSVPATLGTQPGSPHPRSAGSSLAAGDGAPATAISRSVFMRSGWALPAAPLSCR